LHEVEEALSLLQGRHPQHERARRETMTAAGERRRVLAKELAHRARRRVRRWLLLAFVFASFGAAGSVAWQLLQRTRAIRTAFAAAQAAEPFEAHGWDVLATNELTAAPHLEADVAGESCYVAVATGRAAITVQSGSLSVSGASSAGFCACGPARVDATASGVPGALVGLKLLRADGRAIGGPLARAWWPVAPRAWGEGAGGECAEAELDAWLSSGHARPEPVDPAEAGAGAALSPEAVGVLLGAGFRAVAGVPPTRPFGGVDARPGDCLLAVAKEDESLSLRAAGGARLVEGASGAMAWCGSAVAASTVWRTGAGTAAVWAVPGARVGGLLGTREWAAAAGIALAPAATWLAAADLDWEAAMILRASLGAGNAPGTPLPTEPGPRDARILALALSPGARLASDPPSARVICAPPFELSAPVRSALCAPAEPVAFWRQPEALAAAARADAPFWLAPLDPAGQPDAAGSIPLVLSLARRLGALGFVATMLEGVTEVEGGVRVVGRAGEDAIVAVGLAPKAPWIFPYTDRNPWELGDPPRIVPLAPGEEAKLTGRRLPDLPLEKRRTVVFRRALRKGD